MKRYPLSNHERSFDTKGGRSRYVRRLGFKRQSGIYRCGPYAANFTTVAGPEPFHVEIFRSGEYLLNRSQNAE